jgi:adenine-specific DNA-methyltransferase
MAKKVESIKHKGDTRAHIPSHEEAGYENANAKVQDGKKVLELPNLDKPEPKRFIGGIVL